MRVLSLDELDYVSGGDGWDDFSDGGGGDFGDGGGDGGWGGGDVSVDAVAPSSKDDPTTVQEVVVTMHKPTDGDIGIELIEVGGGLILLGAIGLGVAATGGSALPLATAGIVTASTLIGAGGAALAAQGLSMLPHGTRAQL